MTHLLLKINKTEYEYLLWNKYFEWCQSVSMNRSELQVVMISKPILNWWKTEYQKCEQEFRLTLKGYKYSELDAQTLLDLYDRCTHKMLNISPKVLIKQVKDNPLTLLNYENN